MRRQRCGQCSRRGNPVAGTCPQCGRPYCTPHSWWDGERWICSGCYRKLMKSR